MLFLAFDFVSLFLFYRMMKRNGPATFSKTIKLIRVKRKMMLKILTSGKNLVCRSFLAGRSTCIKMNVKVHFLLAGWVLMALFSGCEYETMNRYNVGNDFVYDPTNMVMIDTMTVYTSTILDDSVVTSKGARLLAGRCRDMMGVETYTEGYFRIAPPALYTLHELAEFDSACFILYLDGYWYGDTTKVANFTINYLEENMQYDEDKLTIYQFNRFKYRETPLASFSVDLNALDDDQDSVMVKLPFEDGKIFYDMFHDSLNVVAYADTFKQAYKGFVIRPADTNPTFVAGFLMNPDSVSRPKLRVYYTDNQLSDKYFNKNRLYFDYALLSSEDSCKYYVSSYIENNFLGTPFEGLKSDESFYLPSSETGEITMIQGGVNVRTRIEIPFMDNLYDLGYGAIIKAVLYYDPVEEYYGEEFFRLPKTMGMYLIDRKNKDQSSTILPLVDTEGTNAYAALYENRDFPNKSVYTFDITRFVKDDYDSKAIDKYKLALALPPDSITSKGVVFSRLLGNSVDRVYIGSPQNKANKLKLKVYMSYNNY